MYSYYFRHSISKNQYQYLTPCNVEDNKRANNWSLTQSFYDNKHYAKHSYNNNIHLKIINEVSIRRFDFNIKYKHFYVLNKLYLFLESTCR